MKIGRKVGLLVGGLLLVDVATLGVSGGVLLRSQARYDQYTRQAITDVAAANHLKDAYQAQNSAWDQMVINARNPTRLTALMDTFATSANEVENATAQLIAAGNPALKASTLTFVDIQRLVVPEQLSRVGSLNRGTYRASPVLAAHQAEALEMSAAPLQAVNDQTRSRFEEQRARDRRLFTVLAVSAGALVLALGAMAVAMTRRIVNPIRAMISGALEAADHRLPGAVAQVRSMEGSVEPPPLERFTGTTNDELDQLAGALNRMQDSALDMAVDVRRAELRHSETLVNLGRRNQSMLTRTLGYVAELERSERNPDTLAKLFRLDHLATRIRRNAESMLVLAGAQQSRTHSRPVPVTNLLRASLAEIEEYTRVQIVDLQPVTFLGASAADTSHLLAELLENATHFSPDESSVTVNGSLRPDGYVFSIRDQGLGMGPDELLAANERLRSSGAEGEIEDTKLLGHHIVARIASRRGIRVHLESNDPAGITAVVTVPSSLLLESRDRSSENAQSAAGPQIATVDQARDIPEDQRRREVVPTAKTESSDKQSPPAAAEVGVQPAPEPDQLTRTESQDPVVVEQAPVASEPPAPVVARREPRNTAPHDSESAGSDVPSEGLPVGPEPSVSEETGPVPAASVDPPLPTQVGESGGPAAPRRRVRGANLGDIADEVENRPSIPRDASGVRAALSGLQSGVSHARTRAAAVRQEVTPPQETVAPASAAPAVEVGPSAEPPLPSRPVADAQPPAPVPERPKRRVRGAQLPDLGDGMPESDGSPRDAGKVRSQMSGLQASVAKARRDAAEALANRNDQQPTQDQE